MVTGESPGRRKVLDPLRTAPGPLGVTEAAGRLGLHPDTVRFHLDALVAEGRAERTAEAGEDLPRGHLWYVARSRRRSWRWSRRASGWSGSDPRDTRRHRQGRGRWCGPRPRRRLAEAARAASLNSPESSGKSPQPYGNSSQP